MSIGRLLFLNLHCIIMFFISNSLSSSVLSICRSTRIVTEILTFSLSDPISLSLLLRCPFFRSSNCTSSLFLRRSYVTTSARKVMITSGKRTFARKGKYCRIFTVMRLHIRPRAHNILCQV